MPDDLQIPIVTAGPGSRAPVSASYHPRAASHRGTRGVSPGTVMMAGGAACALLLAAVGGWALLHRGPATIPVIEADSRPVRIKPENPGGAQYADGEDTPGGPQSMAPAAEAPAPQALRAQMQPQPAPATAPAPAVAAAPLATTPPATAPAAGNASPLPDTNKGDARQGTRTAQATIPGPTSAPPPAAAASARPGTTPAAAGGTAVQVAALDSEAAAQGEWQRLAKKMPDLLGDRRPVVQKAERDGKAIWRLRIAGFGDLADATGFCGKLRARGASCAIASF